MGNWTISMAIFNSYVTNFQRVLWILMDILWIFYGSFMDMLWIFYGSFMDILWIFRYFMDILWIFYGYLDISWIFYGYVMFAPFFAIFLDAPQPARHTLGGTVNTASGEAGGAQSARCGGSAAACRWRWRCLGRIGEWVNDGSWWLYNGYIMINDGYTMVI